MHASAVVIPAIELPSVKFVVTAATQREQVRGIVVPASCTRHKVMIFEIFFCSARNAKFQSHNAPHCTVSPYRACKIHCAFRKKNVQHLTH
jgi:hypothetical protein